MSKALEEFYADLVKDEESIVEVKDKGLASIPKTFMWAWIGSMLLFALFIYLMLNTSDTATLGGVLVVDVAFGVYAFFNIFISQWLKSENITDVIKYHISGGLIAVILFILVSDFTSSTSQKTNKKSSAGSTSSSLVRTDDYTTERSYEEYGDRDCSDFSSQSEAQEFFEDEGGPDEDYHNLDRDGDGMVCESL